MMYKPVNFIGKGSEEDQKVLSLLQYCATIGMMYDQVSWTLKRKGYFITVNV